jgi:hypothetical protein
MKVIPVMCRAKLDIYVFFDFPVFIPWTHQMKVIPGMCRAKLDIYVFIDFPVFIPWTHQMKVILGGITFICCIHGINTGKSKKTYISNLA